MSFLHMRPGTIDRANALIDKSRISFFFHISTVDLENELKKLNNALASDLLKELKSQRVPNKIKKNAVERLKSMTPTSSSRVKTILMAMKKNMKLKRVTGGDTKYSGKVNNIVMNLYNVNIMDEKTNLKRLDKRFPQKHIAPFAKDPIKKLSPAARAYRGTTKFSLWRMFEYKTQREYSIPLAAKGPLVFKMKKDSYSKWHVKRVVNWNASGSGGVANTAYYLLNSSRKIYKEDKEIFANSIGRGVQNIIRTKTRFR